MEKVRLPKEVAEAIDYFRSIGYSNIGIIREVSDPQTSESGRTLKKFLTDDGDYNVLMDALINGFEVEQTPEDKVREHFKRLLEDGKHNEANIIHVTLDDLGIKIEGVNA